MLHRHKQQMLGILFCWVSRDMLMLYFSLDKRFSVFITKLVFQLRQLKLLVPVHHLQSAIPSLGLATFKWFLRLSWRMANFCNLKANDPTKYLRYAEITTAYVCMVALCFSMPHIHRMAAYCCLTVAHYMLENSSMSARGMYFHQLLRYSVMVCISLNRSFQCSDQQISWVCYSTTVVVFHYISDKVKNGEHRLQHI